jgi:hypothetical protein
LVVFPGGRQAFSLIKIHKKSIKPPVIFYEIISHVKEKEKGTFEHGNNPENEKSANR